MKNCPQCGTKIEFNATVCHTCNCDLACEYVKTGMALEKQQDFAKAFEFFKLSADLGNMQGLEKIARYFEDGIGVQKNTDMALDCWIKAGKMGSAYAQYKVGWTYHCQEDMFLAAEWYKQAIKGQIRQAKKGLCDVAFYMLMYPRQGHKEHDEKLGFELMNLAADAGETEAYSHLGFCYQKGTGTGKDLHKAKFWFAKAVEAGEDYFKILVESIDKQLKE